MLDVIVWGVGSLAVIFIVVYAHHRFKMKTDSYYRFKVGEAQQGIAFERSLKRLRRKQNETAGD